MNYCWKELSLIEFLQEGNIPSGWIDFFSDEKIKNELCKISKYLETIRDKVIYPTINYVFRAFYLTPFNKLKAIILGQDPYYNGAAVGLCFSVASGYPINPSLRNINNELINCGYQPKENGNLIGWAKQGVLLLNVALTVEKDDPESHSLLWSKFSEYLMEYIIKNDRNVKWLLFGSHAHNCIKNLDVNEKNIFKTTHPSPLGASRPSKTAVAFLGSKVFLNVPEIKW